MLRTATRAKLCQEAQRVKLAGRYQNLSRNSLIEVLAAIRIQRMWRRRRPRNMNDPFTLDPFSTPLRFFHIEDAENIWQFEPQSLYQYFLSSGTFNNPFTRKPFLKPELRRLDRLLKKRGSFVALADHAVQISRQHRQFQEHASTVELLYQEAFSAMECLWEPQALTFENFMNTMDWVYDVCQRLLPTFLTQINDLRQRDSVMAQRCVENVLYRLAEVGREVPTFLGPSFYSMSQRNAAASAYFLLMDYYNMVYRNSANNSA